MTRKHGSARVMGGSSYVCPLCGRVELHWLDVSARFCACCGSESRPRDCVHRRAEVSAEMTSFTTITER